MTIKICISNYLNDKLYFEVSNNDVKYIRTRSEFFSYNQLTRPYTLKCLKLFVDGTTAFYILREIQSSTQYRQLLLTEAKLKGLELILIQINPPKKEFFDYKWNNMIGCLLQRRIESEILMSWLSTLGGGFSALGEQFTKCAEIAGKISLKQLSIGMQLSDPFLQARCKLYYSISLIQIGKLKLAKDIVWEQYKFAKANKEHDSRLVKMCKGIGLRIQHEYRMRIEEKKKEKLALTCSDKT